MHFLIGELREIPYVKVLAKNGEGFKIQDSLEHMPTSLDALVKDLGQLENCSIDEPFLQYRKNGHAAF